MWATAAGGEGARGRGGEGVKMGIVSVAVMRTGELEYLKLTLRWLLVSGLYFIGC